MRQFVVLSSSKLCELLCFHMSWHIHCYIALNCIMSRVHIFRVFCVILLQLGDRVKEQWFPTGWGLRHPEMLPERYDQDAHMSCRPHRHAEPGHVRYMFGWGKAAEALISSFPLVPVYLPTVSDFLAPQGSNFHFPSRG